MPYGKKVFPWYGYLYIFLCFFTCGKQNYTCRKQNEVSKFVHVVCNLRNMAMCRRNLQLKLLKAMVEENDVLNELYGVIIMRKIQMSKRKHRFWIHNIIKKRKRFGVFYYLVKELQLDQNKYMEYFRMSSQQMELALGFVGPLISKQYRCHMSQTKVSKRFWKKAPYKCSSRIPSPMKILTFSP